MEQNLSLAGTLSYREYLAENDHLQRSGFH